VIHKIYTDNLKYLPPNISRLKVNRPVFSG